MTSTLHILTFFLLFVLSIQSQVFAQQGKYDIRLVEHSIDCDSSIFLLDIEIRAFDDTSHFNLADQNFRLSFNRSAFRAYDGNLPPAQRSVQIDSELTLSGLTQAGSTTSFYSPHTLTGSLDTVLSYNVTLSGGDGYPLTDTAWVSVGRISLQIVDITACANLWVHTMDPTEFPPTFVSEKFNNMLFETQQGNFYPYSQCFSLPCPQNEAPISNDDYINTFEGFPVVYNILFNDIDNDNNIDPTTLVLLSSPPANEATVAAGPGVGEITVTPVGIWAGNVTPFDYKVCDTFGECSTASVFVTIDDDPTTGFTEIGEDRSIKVFPTLADDVITIAFDFNNSNEMVSYELVDAQGRNLQLNTREVNGKQSHQINIEKLPPGTYFINFRLKNTRITEKFIKY